MKGFIANFALGTIFLSYKHYNQFVWPVLLWNKCTEQFEFFVLFTWIKQSPSLNDSGV